MDREVSTMETATNNKGVLLTVGDNVIKTYEDDYTVQVEITKLFEGRNNFLYAECKKGRSKAFFNIDSLTQL